MRAPLILLCVLSLPLSLPLTAEAQSFGVRVTPSGMDTLTAVALDRVPSDFVVPTMDRVLYECPGSSVISASIPNTPVHIGWKDIDLRTEDGRIVLGATIDVDVATPVTLENPYACFGHAVCDVSASIRNLGVTVELAAGSAPEGGVAFHGVDVQIDLAPEDLDVRSESCAIGDVATWLFNAFESWALDLLVPRLEAMADEQVAAAIGQAFGETVGLTVHRDDLTIEGWLDSLDLSAMLGITAIGGAHITWDGPALHAGAPPPVSDPDGEALPRDMVGMFQLAASDRLVTEVLYDAWRGGLISRMLADQSQSIVLGGAGAAQQIGLPADTRLDVSFDIERPLAARFGRIAPNVADITLQGLHVQVRVHPPGGEASTIDLRADGSMAAGVAVDASAGALTLDVQSFTIDRVELAGENSELTVDGARLRAFVQGTVMPMLAERVSGLPIAPAVLPVAGTFAYVRALEARGGWARVGVDLFTPSASDRNAPETTLEDPPTLLPAGTASFTASGVDGDTPASLLRYRAWVDGQPLRDGEATSIRQIRFDATDGDHLLEVAAVDLADNVDLTPVQHLFTVDATPPVLDITEAPSAIVLDSAVRVAWRASDDRGGPIASHWELRSVADDGALTVVQDAPFAPDRGVLEISTDTLDVGRLYELELVVRDEAGNLTSHTFGFALHPSLASGCSASAGSSGAPAPLFAFLVALFGGVVWSRRRV